MCREVCEGITFSQQRKFTFPSVTSGRVAGPAVHEATTASGGMFVTVVMASIHCAVKA